jgi:hypothetical protein
LIHAFINPLALLKLALATAVFVLLALYGARRPRLTGMLLTFPTLNGVALLSSTDPARVAQTVYQLVQLNCIIFWIAITFVRWLPRQPSPLSPGSVFALRLTVWSVAWIVLAYPLTRLHDNISTPVLCVIYTVFAAAAIFYGWQEESGSGAQNRVNHQRLAWIVRISLFVLMLLCLAYVVRTASDQKWAGMASALPLPGLFALTSLSLQGEKPLLSIRDTVLLGPLLVIPFNWLFALIAVRLPSGGLGQLIGALTLVLMWAAAFGCITLCLPRFEQCLDLLRRNRNI